jgi:CubicO group peptidase (beta-lactamase class C family)
MLNRQLIIDHLRNQHFDCCAVASIDFAQKTYEWVDVNPFEKTLFYDLASLTKPLTLAATLLKYPELFTDDLQLLLNHRSGITSGGRLSRDSWKEQIEGYLIRESQTCYSDYGALRLQLELENRSGKSLRDLASYFWDEQLLHHLDLVDKTLSPITGTRQSKPIQGVVHDDNAYVLNCFTSHAGLFATAEGLAKSLLSLDEKGNLLEQMQLLFQLPPQERFIAGWDRVEDCSKTLAGKRASIQTFGHLGFTGTSMWIDLTRQQGIVILTNATKNYWYSRVGLNRLRREIADMLWR